MSQPTPGARSAVDVLVDLVTQVKRIADHTASGSFALAPPPVVGTDDDATTGDDDATCRRMETRTCPQPYNGPCGERPCARFESDDPAPWLDTAETPAAADDAPSGPVIGHATIGITAAYHGEQAPASEQTLRWLRRESLLVLLTRISRGRLFGEDEARTLRTYVETEMREADRLADEKTMNTAGQEQLRSVLEYEHKRANDAITREETAEEAAEEQRKRAQIFEAELRTLRAGIRALGGDPTTIQNLWAQISLRNRQWAEAKREARAFRAMLEAEGGDVALVDEMLDTVAAAEAKARDAEQKLSDAETLGHKLLKRAETAEAAAQREARVSASLVRSTKLLLERRTTRLLERAKRTEAVIARVRQMTDAWEQRLPETIVKATVVEALRHALDGTEQPAAELVPYSQLRAAHDESWQLIEMQKDLLGTLRRIVMTATSDREDAQVTAERCEHCGRDHMAELYDAIVAADERYAATFPATSEGPACPGRLPEQPTTEA